MSDVIYDALVGTGNYVRQITQGSFDPNIQVLNGRMSGQPNIAAQFVESASPEYSLSTPDIGGFLATFGTVGGQIADGSLVAVPWQKRALGGTFAGASSNVVISGIGVTGSAPNNCPVQYIPRSISAPRMGPCMAQGELHFLSYDGVTVPWVAATGLSLPSQVFNELYGLGPVYINGTLVPFQVGYTVNFGLGWSEKQHFSGTPYPTTMFLETIEPQIELTVEDFNLLATITGGLPITSVTAYMRKRALGGTYVSDSSTVHVKFSFATPSWGSNAGFAIPKAMSASETKHGQAGICLAGLSLTASYASAVTAP